MTVWLKMWFNSENSLFNAEFMPYFLPVNDEYMFTSAVKKMLIQLCIWGQNIQRGTSTECLDLKILPVIWSVIASRVGLRLSHYTDTWGWTTWMSQKASCGQHTLCVNYYTALSALSVQDYK